MLITDFGLKPEQTIYYIIGQILHVLKQGDETEENIILKIFGTSPKPYEIYRFNIALYVLLLLEKFRVYIRDEEIVYVYQEVNVKNRNRNNYQDN
ncbi:hypothetical protein [Lactococcus petauri]|uniref:Uncharacterized protein n=1 Tax=Lactococcus petauri TaxID=1940789 RepID=A0A252CCE3_9LACT|nr:hypothetical protein [Lactococcus petauri]OUK04188.1 hypothetical protein BZZ03_06845 [Lactococcus petauri]